LGTSFSALSRKEKEVIVEKLLHDKEFMEDLIDIVILEQRKKEPSRPLEGYLAERRKKRT